MQRLRVLFVDLDGPSEAGKKARTLLADAYDVTLSLNDGASCEDSVAVVLVASSLDELATRNAVVRLSTMGKPLLLVGTTSDTEIYLRLLHAGASDFVRAPVDGVELRSRLRRLVDPRGPRDGALGRLKATPSLEQIIGESPAFVAAIEDISIIARCESTVFIRGETGTGKEVFARAIHNLSPRSKGPMVPINCGAFPAELVENELFGHERAAYTGAVTSSRGLVAEAEHGTLFLDDVDTLPVGAQVKLLRLLQERTYRKLGSTQSRTADVRFVAASNTDLVEAVKSGRLRRDLYYRLDVLPLLLPPLRERGDDVLLLAKHFAQRHARELGRTPPVVDPDAARILLGHDWPGNVRELDHVIERAVLLARDPTRILAEDIRLPEVSNKPTTTFQEAKARAIERFETGYLTSLLRLHKGNVTHAAHAAGKDPRALRQLIRKHGLDVDRHRSPV